MFIRLHSPRLKSWDNQTNGGWQIKKDAAAPKAAYYIVKNNFYQNNYFPYLSGLCSLGRLK
jgi:hypothetical protein